MSIKNIRALFPFLMGTLLLGGCNGLANDTTAPVIEYLRLSSKDISTGTSFEVETNVIDDYELNQVKFDIHDQFDGHSHGKIAGIPWEESRIVPVDGNGYLLIELFVVPSNAAAGPYHVVVQVLDRAGNSGQFKEADFWISNAEMASIQLTAPNLSPIPQYNSNETMTLEGTIVDNHGIDEVTFKIFKDEVTYFEFDEDLEGQGITNFNLDEIPTITFDSATFGSDSKELNLLITAVDNDGNISHVEGKLQYN